MRRAQPHSTISSMDFSMRVVPTRPTTLQRLQPRALASGQNCDSLQPWQTSRLVLELKKGRRAVKVNQVANELQLSRDVVLRWLKDQPAVVDSGSKDITAVADDRLQKSLAGARAAAEEAARQRQAILQQRDGSGSSSDSAAVRGNKQQGQFGSSPAPWRRSERNKPLGRQAEATLETVFARTQWPSDEVVASLWDLHRLPRERVVAWFAERRRQVSARSKQRAAGQGGRGGRASGGGDGSGAGGWRRQQQGGSTDWDAEWGSDNKSQ